MANTYDSELAAEPSSIAANRRSRLISSVKHGFQALQVRNYRLFWGGQLISQTGSWMQRTAQDWLVLQLTNSPFALGLVTALQFLPVLLLSLISGVLIDRWSKHFLVIITQVASLLQAAVFTLLVATGSIQLWHVYILAAVQGIITAIDNPVRQAFVVELVGRDHLVNAVALNSMVFNASRIVGPALAGIMIAKASSTYAGVAFVLAVNVVSFIAVLAGLLIMRPEEFTNVSTSISGNMRQHLIDGLVYVWNTPSVMLVMIVVAAIGTFGYNFSVILPLLSGFVLHTDAAEFGALSAFLGFGSLVAALVVAYMRHVTVGRLLGSSLCFGFLLAAVAVSTNYWLSGLILIALGFAGILFSTSANTLLQLTVPDELRGRVLSVYMLLFVGSTPIGGFLIGAFSSRIGVSETLLICAALCLLGVFGAMIYNRRAV